MRLWVEVREQDEEPLRTFAVKDHRSVREQGGYLLHLKIQEELARQHETEPAAEVA